MRKPIPDKNTTASDLRNEIIKLGRQIENLDRTTGRLLDRLRVPPDEFGAPLRNWGDIIKIFGGDTLFSDELEPNLPSLRAAVIGINWSLDGLHRDIGLIRAHMDAVANDAQLSDTFKSYLKPNDKR